jgi:uncharacterized protein (DUF433 family)/DNA-binding transcriptional MerR regulator
MAYPTDVTAALTGATVRQLSYWRKAGRRGSLLEPEYRTGNRVLYSFRDVLALRTFVFLREEFSLQKIRVAVNNLRWMGETSHLSSYRLVTLGNEIALVEDDGTATYLTDHPGARQLFPLSKVINAFTTDAGAKIVDLLRPRPGLSVDPKVRSGYPTVRDTRVPYDLVATLVADGVRPEDVKGFYPAVDAAGAKDAHSFALYVASFRNAG